MKRKLIRQGTGGYTIYLPKSWLQKHNLLETRSVDIAEVGEYVIVKNPESERIHLTIDLTGDNDGDIRNVLTHSYRSGIHAITFTNVNKEVYETISTTVDNLLLGFEITQYAERSCTVKSVSEPSHSEYEVVLRKCFLLIRETHDVLIRDLTRGDFSNEALVSAMRRKQDKFILFCRRLLMMGKASDEPITSWELLTFLMHIEHSYFYTYRAATRLSSPVSRDILELASALRPYFDHLYRAYYEKDIREIHELNEKKSQFQFGECYRVLEQSQGTETVLAAHIRELFRIMQIGSSPILARELREI